MAFAQAGTGLFDFTLEAGGRARIDKLRAAGFESLLNLIQRADDVAAGTDGEVTVGHEVGRKVFNFAAGRAPGFEAAVELVVAGAAPDDGGIRLAERSPSCTT